MGHIRSKYAREEWQDEDFHYSFVTLYGDSSASEEAETHERVKRGLGGWLKKFGKAIYEKAREIKSKITLDSFCEKHPKKCEKIKGLKNLFVAFKKKKVAELCKKSIAKKYLSKICK